MTELEKLILSATGKRILGINPPVFDFAYYDFWSKPTGLLYLLQMLRDKGNYVELLDCIYEARTSSRTYGRHKTERTKIDKPAPYQNIPRKYYHFGIREEALSKKLTEKPRPDMILVTSGMTYWYPGVFWCIDVLKRLFPDVPVILGGTYAMLCPEHAKLSKADFIQTKPLAFDLAYPAMNLYDKPEYGISLTSRGCPMSCGYCASKILWPEFEQRSMNEIILEIESQLAIPTIHHIAFYDDALLLDKHKRFYPLCRYLQTIKGVAFHTPNGLHVREIDLECAEYLYNSGFKTIRLSLESIDPSVQMAGSGKVFKEQYERAVYSLTKAGYDISKVETYILAGLPGQSLESIADSIRFVQGLGATAKLTEFSPIPGTRLFQNALSIVPALSDEPLLHNNSVYCAYISKSLPPEQLQKLKDITNK